jgi:hypothetical protein
MPTQPTDSTQKPSPNNLNRQVGMYSLAAAVAGVSLLALAEPAAGEVVVTRKTIPIPVEPQHMRDPVRISMANDGVNNFSFSLTQFSSPGFASNRGLAVGGVNLGQAHNEIMQGGTFYPEAFALARGAKIGPSALFSSTFALVENTDAFGSFSRGYWGGNLKNRYLGVRFQINGQFHYGWVRLTVTANAQLKKQDLSATITGYAYETVPNKPILAGTAEKVTADVPLPESVTNQSEPSLGMLALGADGLPLWRRDETSASQ